MGQKVNPHGLRVGVIKGWDSKWYAGKDYEKFLLEDIKILEFIKEKQDDVDTFIVHCTAGISRSGAIGMFIKDYFSCEIESENSLIPNPLVSAELRKFAWWSDGENN